MRKKKKTIACACVETFTVNPFTPKLKKYILPTL